MKAVKEGLIMLMRMPMPAANTGPGARPWYAEEATAAARVPAKAQAAEVPTPASTEPPPPPSPPDLAPELESEPETPRECQMEYLILLDKVPFYDNPSVDNAPAGTLAKGTSLLGSEMVTDDGISMLRSADDAAVCGPYQAGD
jgi:hypothetical protein